MIPNNSQTYLRSPSGSLTLAEVEEINGGVLLSLGGTTYSITVMSALDLIDALTIVSSSMVTIKEIQEND